jgi:hypothetical protein
MLTLMATAVGISAATSGHAYGDCLLAWELSRHRQFEYAAIELENGAQNHFQAGSRAARGAAIVLPLADALANHIGAVTLVTGDRSGNADAAPIAADISRHIYTAAGLAEPDPFVPGAVRSARGQQLVERELRREPSLVTIAFHVALPGRDNRIIASNFGRIGKLADQDDQRVISTSTVAQEVTNGGKRVAIELPMLDRSGQIIGALSTSFTIGAEGQQAARRSALRIQRDLSRSIPRVASLAE